MLILIVSAKDGWSKNQGIAGSQSLVEIKYFKPLKDDPSVL